MALNSAYFDDTDENLSLSSKLKNLEADAVEIYDKINKYKTRLLDSNPEEKSISSIIEVALNTAKNDSHSIQSLLLEVKEKINAFESYYADVFGRENEEGEIEGGLKKEINTRRSQLDEFKTKQEKQYEALNKEIESLLPGATSAGLASAYYDLKKSFDTPIKFYSGLFYISILLLTITALFSISQEIGWFHIKFIDTSNLNSLMSNLLYKLPIALPVLWLTIFASKRRSEASRLQQEYAHKEALAKSYQGFKTQIESLNEQDPSLMTKLLSSAIDAISKNSSETLDNKHGDKLPTHEVLDNLVGSMEKLKKALTQ